MAVIDFPAIVPDAEDWTLTYNTQSFQSDLNGGEQTAELPGARWSVSLTFTNRQGRDARALQGFMAGLKGGAGRFYITPSDWEPLGSPSGSPTVATAQNGGASTLETTGWDAEVTDLFVTGDYFEINGELKKLTADVDSDASGDATLQFAPPLRIAATVGQSIRYVEPRCIMKLMDDGQASWSVSAPIIYGVTFDAREALDI